PRSSDSSINHSVKPVVFQAVPEHCDGIEDLVCPLEEPGFVEPRIEENPFELLHGVAGVLSLDAVVPGVRGNFPRGQPRCVDVKQPMFQLLPETGGGPVLDREARSLGDSIFFAAVKPLKLVAEPQGGATSVPALAQIVETQAECLADGQQPFEVRGAEPEDP